MRAELLRSILEQGGRDMELQALYPGRVSDARSRYVTAIERFCRLFGQKDIALFSAPGRTEIGGNHTDHQGGKVIAAAVDLDIIAVASPCREDRIQLVSEGFETVTVSLAETEPRRVEQGTTQALVRGIVAGCKKRGYSVNGFVAYVQADVPPGSGLSSSAAFEMLVVSIINAFSLGNKLNTTEMAVIGREAENAFFGKPCGLMDQIACANGSLVWMDFQTKLPVVTPIAIDFAGYGYAICIVDAGDSHEDLTEAYASIPQEMKNIASLLGQELLHQVREQDFYGQLKRLRNDAGDRAVLRAMHWFEENRRVDAQRQSLEAGDMDGFLEQVRLSGRSSYELLQNVLTVDPRKQGLAFTICFAERLLKGHGAVRVHGGGFAGTVQVFLPESMVEQFCTEMNACSGKDICRLLHIRKKGAGIVMD